MSKLEGEALTAAAVLENPSFDELISQLTGVFFSERQELAALKLQNRLQKPDETLETWPGYPETYSKAFPSADEQTKLVYRAFFLQKLSLMLVFGTSLEIKTFHVSEKACRRPSESRPILK